MGFGGSVSAMLASLKQNKRQRKSRFEAKNLRYDNSKNKFVDFKKLSPAEERKLKIQISDAAQKHKRKVILYTFIAILILGALIWWLIYDSGRPLI